jgi:hypothetical protein
MNCSKGQYWLAIERQLEGNRHEDPPTQAKLTVCIKVVNYIHVIGNIKAIEKERAMGDMCLIAFYNTLNTKNANQHTTQFCAKDITFWDKNLCVIQHNSNLE